MKSIIYIYITSISFLAKCQEIEKKEKFNDVNYTIGTIYWSRITKKDLSSCKVVILEQSDPKNTPKELFDGYGGTVSNLIISVSNLGEFSDSELYFVNGVISPQIIKIEEDLARKLIKIKVSFKDKKFKDQQRTYEIKAIY